VWVEKVFMRIAPRVFGRRSIKRVECLDARLPITTQSNDLPSGGHFDLGTSPLSKSMMEKATSIKNTYLRSSRDRGNLQ
jgi:hypothetical protein